MRRGGLSTQSRIQKQAQVIDPTHLSVSLKPIVWADHRRTNFCFVGTPWRQPGSVGKCAELLAWKDKMARHARLFALALVMALPMPLGGCAGVLFVGSLAEARSAGYLAGQERGASDFEIKTGIENTFIQTDPRLQSGITTTVYNQRVLLTGRVPSPELKAAAVQIASQTQDVRAVYDEIELAPSEGMWDNAQDTWISTRVRSEMALDSVIRSANYTVDTENGSVYLIGSARSQAELDRATGIARYVPGVKRVISYVEIRPGEPVAAASSAVRPSGTAAVDTPSAVPKSAIEVQKL